MCVVVQQRLERSPTNGIIEKREYMYLIGGYAAWPRDDPKWDDGRTRNDVWITSDGINWSRISPANEAVSMPFVGRGWHSCITWHDPKDKFRKVGGLSNIHFNLNLTDEELKKTWPRIYLAGGGYTGTKGNNVVSTLEGYLDLWSSQDGSKWIKVNYQEGFKDSQYSTNEWTHTLVKDTFYYLGKWGHSIEAILLDIDLNNDGLISSGSVEVQVCTPSSRFDVTCKIMNVTEYGHPTLILIGGDTTDGGPIVNDVFMSKPGSTSIFFHNYSFNYDKALIIRLLVFCEVDGISCSRRGLCGPAEVGCICHNSSFYGEYCENVYSLSSAALRNLPSSVMIVAALLWTSTFVWVL